MTLRKYPVDYDAPEQSESPSYIDDRAALIQFFCDVATGELSIRQVRNSFPSPHLGDLLDDLESSGIIEADRSNVLITRYRRVLQPVKKKLMPVYEINASRNSSLFPKGKTANKFPDIGLK